MWPLLGCGVGLRTDHYDLITREWPGMDWFEAVSENFIDSGGRPLSVLEKVRARYPVALHGVSLSIGSADPLDETYLKKLKTLADRIEPVLVTDHLCWNGVAGECLHDLLPLPFTEEAIRHVVRRVQKVQGFLGRRILLENISTYITYKHSEMPEWVFLSEIARRSGCGILLDLNNLYVNSVNHRFEPEETLRNIPGEFVGQFHLAGHTDKGKYLFDTHNSRVIEPVWELYRKALCQWGAVATLIEWDEAIPDFPGLSEESKKARAIYEEVTKGKKDALEAAPSQKPVIRPRPPEGPDLATLQCWMKSQIRPSGGGKETFSESPLNPQGGDPGIVRMEVYASGYLARMKEALEEVYEAVHHLTGEGVFSRLATDYAKQFPSRHYNLSAAGVHFSRFLEMAEITEKLPFLPDLVRLEWKVNQAFHAFEKPPLSPEIFQSVPEEKWDDLVFEFQPSVGIVSSGWPILDLWQARKTPRKEIDIQVVDRPQTVLIFRKGFQVRCENLERGEAALLEGLLAGRSLGDVCGSLADFSKDLLPDLTGTFRNWMQKGLLICYNAGRIGHDAK